MRGSEYLQTVALGYSVEHIPAVHHIYPSPMSHGHEIVVTAILAQSPLAQSPPARSPPVITRNIICIRRVCMLEIASLRLVPATVADEGPAPLLGLGEERRDHIARMSTVGWSRKPSCCSW